MPVTVLLVEDDPLFRETVRDTLVAAGYQALEAADGVEALDRVRECHPDLVLLDFDLPRMMGDEALERMLQLRPGLICYVLSGKDDLHQALLMGRRGAYGWIDKYVGTDRLLTLVAEGLKTRPRGLDLQRLVATSYPQPVAVPFLKWKRSDHELPPIEHLAVLRELFEAIVSYLGITAAAIYLNRGLLEDEINQALVKAVEKPTPAAWLEAVYALLPRYLAQPRIVWWSSLARVLTRPLARLDVVDRAVAVIGQQAALNLPGGSRSLFDLFSAFSAFHDLWLTPHLLPPGDALSLAAAIAQALDLAVAELAVLADVEVCLVAQAIVNAEGDFSVSLDSLTGQGIQNRHLRSPTLLRQGELYLISRATHQPLAPLAPLMIYSACDIPGLVSSGVFNLAQIIPERRAMYLSHACGQLRWIDSPQALDAIRHLFFTLNPRGERVSHLLREVAVGLFDLSGYTTLTRQHGPTLAREVVRRMVAAVREAAVARGGIVGEPVGDEVLVYFDDPRSALEAAAETLRTLHQLNARNPEAAAHIHVGMDYGPGVVEHNDVWGDVINRAKRCQTIAQADEIVISAEMAAALGASPPMPLHNITGELKGFGTEEVYKVAWRP